MTITATSPTSTTTTYTLPGVSWLSLDVSGTDGTLKVGPTTVPVRVTPPADGSPARVEADLSEVTLGVLSAAASGSADPLSALPASLAGTLSAVAIASVAVTVDLTAHRLTGVELVLTGAGPWPLVPGRVALDDVAVTISVTRGGDSTMFDVTGTATLAGSGVSLTVAHDDAQTYAVSLTTEGDQRIGAATIAAFVGDDLQSHLPSQLPGLTEAGLADAKVVITTGGVESVELTLSTGSPIALPDPVGVTVEEVSVHVAVEHVKDPATRTVAVQVEGTATFAGAGIVVRIERDPAEQGAAAWTLHAGLADGATLTGSAVAAAYGQTIPSEVPELALSACTLDAVLDGSSVTFTAASPTDWTIPVGPDGLGVGHLSVSFARHAADAEGRTVTGSISGVVHLGGVDVPVTYAVPGGLTLHATIPSVAPFALLQDVVGATTLGALALPPELVALSLTDIELSIDVDQAEVSFAASGPGFKRVQAVARKSTTWGFALGIELDDTYRFSSLSPSLASLDTVHLPDALIVISSFDDTTFTFEELQPVAGKGVSRGLLVDGRLDLSGLGADKFLGEAHLDVKAKVGSSLADLRLEAGIGDVTITDGVVLKDAEFALVPDPENVSVVVSGAVDVTIDSSPLQFVGGVEVVPNGISFFATMKGTWADPFGIKGIALKDVSLKIGSDFEGVPSIGIAGGLVIGAFEGSAAVSFNSELPSQSVLIVAFNHLSLLDVVDTFCPASVTAGIPADVNGTLAGISLDDVDLYVVPQDTTIGALSYAQGLRVGGTLHVAGFTAQAKVEIDQAHGIAASGSLSAITVGDVFSLTGTDPAKGPDLDIEVTATAVPKIQFAGQVNLLGVSASASVDLSDSGFDFDCKGRVFGVFDADIHAKGGNLGSGAGFMVHADFHQSFLDDVARRAAAVLQQAGADAQAQIVSAQHSVDAAQADVVRFGKQVDGAKADLAAKQADAQSKIQGASAQVTQAQNSLGAIDAQISTTRAQIQAQRDAAAANLRDAQQKLCCRPGAGRRAQRPDQRPAGPDQPAQQRHRLVEQLVQQPGLVRQGVGLDRARCGGRLARHPGRRPDPVDPGPARLDRAGDRGPPGGSADGQRGERRRGHLPHRPGPAHRRPPGRAWHRRAGPAGRPGCSECRSAVHGLRHLGGEPGPERIPGAAQRGDRDPEDRQRRSGAAQHLHRRRRRRRGVRRGPRAGCSPRRAVRLVHRNPGRHVRRLGHPGRGRGVPGHAVLGAPVLRLPRPRRRCQGARQGGAAQPAHLTPRPAKAGPSADDRCRPLAPVVGASEAWPGTRGPGEVAFGLGPRRSGAVEGAGGTELDRYGGVPVADLGAADDRVPPLVEPEVVGKQLGTDAVPRAGHPVDPDHGRAGRCLAVSGHGRHLLPVGSHP